VVVPVQVIEGAVAFQDRIEIRSQEVYDRMREGTVFTTSQPTPAAFIQSYQDALSAADTVVAVLLAKELSGTFASGQAAARAVEGDIRVVDSRSASLGLGLLALRGVELVEQGWTADAIATELTRVRDQSGGFFTVDTFDNLLRSGRVGRGKAWLGTLLDVKPILEVTSKGSIAPLDKVRGRDLLIPRIMDHLDRRLTPRPAKLRIGVVHADALETANQLRDAVVGRYAPYECIVHSVTAAIGVHTGAGAWGIFYQIEDAPLSSET
jgi:DegV family protein with EDD domain